MVTNYPASGGFFMMPEEINEPACEHPESTVQSQDWPDYDFYPDTDF